MHIEYRLLKKLFEHFTIFEHFAIDKSVELEFSVYKISQFVY